MFSAIFDTIKIDVFICLNSTHLVNINLLLVRRPRRWRNIKTTLDKRLEFADDK